MRQPDHYLTPLRTRAHQGGAALVVGLILLAILTLLAMTGMNTASTELTMATNERLRDNAFRAAETGLEQTLSGLTGMPQSSAPIVGPVTAITGSATDSFTTSTQYMGDDEQIPGSSAGKFVAFHYEITATGTSARGASAQQRSGAYVVGAGGAGGEYFGSEGSGLP